MGHPDCCGEKMHCHDTGKSGCVYVICYKCGAIKCVGNQGERAR